MSDPLRRWRLATFGALLLAVALGSALATVLLARSHHRHPSAVISILGAGFIYPLLGEMSTMPGLGATPGFMNDLEPYPPGATAGAGGPSVHG